MSRIGPQRNGSAAETSNAPTSERLPRRLVLLEDGEESAIAVVLLEYRGSEIRGSRIHDDLQRQAQAHRGRYVAAEWLAPLGWTRYLWCRK